MCQSSGPSGCRTQLSHRSTYMQCCSRAWHQQQIKHCHKRSACFCTTHPTYARPMYRSHGCVRKLFGRSRCLQNMSTESRFLPIKRECDHIVFDTDMDSVSLSGQLDITLTVRPLWSSGQHGHWQLRLHCPALEAMLRTIVPPIVYSQAKVSGPPRRERSN